MKKYVCDVCGYVYDPAVGDPDGGIAPGTAFEDIPEDWVCPICGVGKGDFSEDGLPKTVDEYFSFIEKELEFLDKRNKRIRDYCIENNL